MEETKQDIEQTLRQFTGTLEFYQHVIEGKEMLLTEGAVYIRNDLKLQWIFDMILYCQDLPTVKKEEFQVWELKKVSEEQVDIVCSDGKENYILEMEATDTMPLDKLTLWFVQGVCMLPSEY